MFFDTLSDNHEELIQNLETLDYANLIDFFAIRNDFRCMTYDIAHRLNLDMIEDTNTTCYYLAKEDALKLSFK